MHSRIKEVDDRGLASRLHNWYFDVRHYLAIHLPTMICVYFHMVVSTSALRHSLPVIGC